MVKLRIINGGKGVKRTTERKVKLFSGYSIVDNFRGHDCVRLNWIYMERRFPVARYETLIQGYTQIGDRFRPYFEDFVKELFTEGEMERLRDWVAKEMGTDVTVIEEPLPLSSISTPMPFREILQGGVRGFFRPSGKSLSFPFCAHYDLAKCPPSVTIDQAASQRGVEFIREALTLLGVDPTAFEASLNETVERIYDAAGLFVDRGKSREERMKERADFFKLQ